MEGQTPQPPQSKTEEKEKIASILVPVEQLIPGIKPAGTTELTYQESRDSDTYATDMYAQNLVRDMDTAFASEYGGPRQDSLLTDGLHGQIVVDLGAGNIQGYLASIAGKAKGYVAVDKYQDLSGLYSDTQKVLETIKENHLLRVEERLPIPAAAVEEDMLIFLRRLPDNSVSIISSGHFALFQNNKYVWEVQKEMDRVLSTEGFLIWDDGIPPDTDREEVIPKACVGGRIKVFVKKDSERYRNSVKEWEAFTKQVEAENDISKLQEMQKQADQAGMDSKHSSFIAQRWLRLRDEKRG